MVPPTTPTASSFRRGVLAFRKHEARDAMYRVAGSLVEHFWGRPPDLADGVGVLLLTFGVRREWERARRRVLDHGRDPRVRPNRAYRTPATGCISTSHAPPRRTVSSVMAPLHIALLARTRQVSVIGTPASSQDGTLR